MNRLFRWSARLGAIAALVAGSVAPAAVQKMVFGEELGATW